MDKATKSGWFRERSALGVALDGAQVDKLAAVPRRCCRRGIAKINLTAITEPRAVVELHFLDSLAVVPLVRDARDADRRRRGAGFPGAVLAIALPSLRVTCIESFAKKVAFLQTLRREVAPNLEPSASARRARIDRDLRRRGLARDLGSAGVARAWRAAGRRPAGC